MVLYSQKAVGEKQKIKSLVNDGLKRIFKFQVSKYEDA